MSKFHLYSLGIVLETKSNSSWIVKLYPVEVIPFRDGDLNETIDVVATVTDISGKTVSANVVEENAIYARWLPMENSNRITPPDVVANETILVYKYSDTDEFFWSTMFYEHKLRRLETVTHLYSNEPTFGKEAGEDNSYWITYDTVNKLIHLHTSDNDGEPVTYDITINAGEGHISILDSKNNTIILNSVDDIATVKTNVEVVIDTPDTTVTGNVHVHKNVVIDGTTEIKKTLDVTEDVTAKASVIVTGDVVVGGATVVTGPISGGGNATITGDVMATGDITATGDMTAPLFIGNLQGTVVP